MIFIWELVVYRLHFFEGLKIECDGGVSTQHDWSALDFVKLRSRVSLWLVGLVLRRCVDVGFCTLLGVSWNGKCMVWS